MGALGRPRADRTLMDEPGQPRGAVTAPDPSGYAWAALREPDAEPPGEAVYRNHWHGIPIKRSRIDEPCSAEGLRRRTRETWFGERAADGGAAEHATDPVCARHGRSHDRHGTPGLACDRLLGPDGVGGCEELPGPVTGLRPAGSASGKAGEGGQSITGGRRDEGSVCGAFKPANGEAFVGASIGRQLPASRSTPAPTT